MFTCFSRSSMLTAFNQILSDVRDSQRSEISSDVQFSMSVSPPVCLSKA